MRIFRVLLTAAAVILPGLSALAAGKASHVVLMVWDGMRPDFVSDATTPTLAAAARAGVTFLHHHPAYPSMTEVNATALATGVYPEQSTIIGNNEYRPAFNPLQPIGTDDLEIARTGDESSGNHYLAYPTVAEILHDNGMRTAVAGSKPVAMLHDRGQRQEGSLGVNVFAGNTLPEALSQALTAALGTFPLPFPYKLAEDDWTTHALTGQLWQGDLPSFSVLWMAEPDYSQHQTGPGSKEALAAIRNSDRNLARMLKTLDEKHAMDSTDVIVVSDHGFSTIQEMVDVAGDLRAHGFHAYRKFRNSRRSDGDTLVVNNGGEVAIYINGHDAELIGRMAHYLQAQPYAGVIFTRVPVEGAFSLSDAKLDSPFAPDIVLAMRWTAAPSRYGVPGMIFSDKGALKLGGGQHASLSVTDMHNTCIAFGPDFVKGMNDSLPSGNVDIAPTILWLLGVTPKEKMSGRVLSEALTMAGPEIKSVTPQHREVEWNGGNFTWRQYLDSSEVNGTIYFDQGNGAQIAHK